MSRLRACGPVIPGIPRLAGVDPARYVSGRYGDQVRYGDGILFLFWAGSRTSHTERWRALSSWYSLLLGCWPFGFPITLILKNWCTAPESLLPGYGYPGKIRHRKKQSSLFSENQ